MSTEMTKGGEPVPAPKGPEPLQFPVRTGNRDMRVDESRVQLAEYWRQDWCCNAEEGTTVQDILEPKYWALVCARFKPYDHIEVRLETGEWIAELIVLQADRLYAKVHLLKLHDLIVDGDETPTATGYMAVWKGPQKKWCILRLADRHIVKEEIADKIAAEQERLTFERNGVMER